MQITAELIEKDIEGIETHIENLKAQLLQSNGALSTLKGVKEYLLKPEPVVEPSTQPQGA